MTRTGRLTGVETPERDGEYPPPCGYGGGFIEETDQRCPARHEGVCRP